MKLREYILEQLAMMVVGDHNAFPYRSSYYITRFFDRCGFSVVHDGSTRKWWAMDRLKELNIGQSQGPDLPSDDILRVIQELLDPDDFDRASLDRQAGLDALNSLLSKQSLVGYIADDGQFHVRNSGTGVSSTAFNTHQRPLSAEELLQRSQVATFLETG